MTEYIHYGSTMFFPELFEPITRAPWMNKPAGGLWASPVNATFGWKQWNEVSRYRECSEENAFRFRLTQNANVVHIRSIDDLRALTQQKHAHEINMGFHLDSRLSLKR